MEIVLIQRARVRSSKDPWPRECTQANASRKRHDLLIFSLTTSIFSQTRANEAARRSLLAYAHAQIAFYKINHLLVALILFSQIAWVLRNKSFNYLSTAFFFSYTLPQFEVEEDEDRKKLLRSSTKG